MKYYSDELNALFSTQEELEKAELEKRTKDYKEKQEKEKKATERKARAKEVEDARKAYSAARAKYSELLDAFVRDYRSYHLSLDGEDAKQMAPTLFDRLVDSFFTF